MASWVYGKVKSFCTFLLQGPKIFSIKKFSYLYCYVFILILFILFYFLFSKKAKMPKNKRTILRKSDKRHNSIYGSVIKGSQKYKTRVIQHSLSISQKIGSSSEEKSSLEPRPEEIANHSNEIPSPLQEICSQSNEVTRTSRESTQLSDFTAEHLAQWSLDKNIMQNQLRSLLQALRRHECFRKFPVDPRSILGTPRSAVESTDVPPGQYVHFGLQKVILNCLEENPALLDIEEFLVQINIDGVPVAKSSTACFWPILGRLFSRSSGTFIIGLYFGKAKPNNPNEFLKSLVDEFKALAGTCHCIVVEGKVKPIKISSFCCDVPAKSFVLMTKGNSGYRSCSRCET